MRGLIKARSQYFKNLQNNTSNESKEIGLIFIQKINSRLNSLNMRTSAANIGKSFQILFESLFFGFCYFVFVYSTFNAIWYLKGLALASSLLFIKLYIDIRLELIHLKINKDIPKTLRKVTHYLISTEGNILKALEKTEASSPPTTRPFISKTILALKSENPDFQIEVLKSKTYSRWVCMFYEMCLFGKKYGENKAEEQKVISQNIKKLTQITSFINLKRGYDNVELLWMQVFTFFLPIIVIPATKYYYNIVHADMGGSSVYETLGAQAIAAQIFFLANISTLFINWLRKDS